MNKEELAAYIYSLSVTLWRKLMPETAQRGGHPGIPGPAGAITENDTPWTMTQGHLEGAVGQLRQVLRHLGEDV